MILAEDLVGREAGRGLGEPSVHMRRSYVWSKVASKTPPCVSRLYLSFPSSCLPSLPHSHCPHASPAPAHSSPLLPNPPLRNPPQACKKRERNRHLCVQRTALSHVLTVLKDESYVPRFQKTTPPHYQTLTLHILPPEVGVHGGGATSLASIIGAQTGRVWGLG